MRYQTISEYNDNVLTVLGYIPMDQDEPLENGPALWRPADWLRLRPVMLDFLREMYEKKNSDIKPTNENVDVLIHTGLYASGKGDPCCAMWKDGVIVGFTFWLGIAGLHPHLEMREKVCTGLGTFIMENHRRQGLSTELRTFAFDVAKYMGYDRVDGSAYDKLGFETAAKFGAKTSSLLLSKRL